MRIHTYLHFSGQCETALKYYQQHLGGKIESMMFFKGSPASSQTPPDWQDKVMHATISIGDVQVMASDGMPGKPRQESHGFSLAITPSSAAEAERIFEALSANGLITMPLQTTFFAARFGSVIDQFGTPWMVHFEK